MWSAAEAPVVPELSDETDTRHFDEIDEDDGPKKTFPTPRVRLSQSLVHVPNSEICQSALNL